MHLARISLGGRPSIAKVVDNLVQPLMSEKYSSLAEVLNATDCVAAAHALQDQGQPLEMSQVDWLPPIDQQEVWAAGVTYKRSQTARMEESEAAKDCYDHVYESDRPELFWKATPSRCSGHLGDLRIRQDSAWNVPEPEFTLVINPAGKIVAYTVGNDMSSRDIEGENPLYLPQAKVYDQCCGLGPWVTLANAMPDRSEIGIYLSIERDGQEVFQGETSVSEMARKVEDLVGWLFRDSSFPNGVFMLTGTGIVPDSTFTLNAADQVHIKIDGIGTLSNNVVQA